MTHSAATAHNRSARHEPGRSVESLSLIDETSLEVERMTVDLASVLTRESAASDWREAKTHSTFSWSGDTGQRSAVDAQMDDEFSNDGAVPANTKAWLHKARRARRRDSLKRAGAWIVTLGIGGIVVALALYFATGHLPQLSWLLPSIF